ncbi:hypothetical protein EBU91_00430 [bacterium]|nr:hypothetical protein [bacterium]
MKFIQAFSLFEQYKNPSRSSLTDTSFITVRENLIGPSEIRTQLLQKKIMPENSPLLLVRGSTQELIYYDEKGQIVKKMPVSTAAKGFGMKEDSGQTPIGLFRIGKKINGKKYEIIIGKKPSGILLGSNQESTRKDQAGKLHQAEVLTGLIELEGLESRNRNTFGRSIYFHGTNREEKLGIKASGGCIRVSNDNILWLIKNLPDQILVYIQPGK